MLLPIIKQSVAFGRPHPISNGMSASIKLISLNIERSQHQDVVLPFLAVQMPDVLCVQELYERDIEKISNALGGAAHLFAPMTRYIHETPPEIMGVGIFSRLPVLESGALFYGGDPALIPELDQDDPATYNNKNFALLHCDVEKDGAVFRLATTHFRWTRDGEADDAQRSDVNKLISALGTLEEFVFGGDFNAPRGGEIFGTLSARYKDNIPPQYTTSLDPHLHRAGHLERMVDGIFSTPVYTVSDVELISGVSDHKALVATVAKTSA